MEQEDCLVFPMTSDALFLHHTVRIGSFGLRA